jgi:chemotaxis protein methyltransferase CheR
LRSDAPVSLFDLVLCRYVAFTYFAPPLQHEVLQRILERLLPGGYLAIGTHERLPADALPVLAGGPHIFEKRTVYSK